MNSMRRKKYKVFPTEEQVELLIEEVERRPVLYDKQMKGYADYGLKKIKWEEVAIAILGEENWASMSVDEKKDADLQIRKRWLHLRNCFSRELRIQRAETPKSKGKKRKKYCYFDQLLFLMPSVELKEPPGSANDNSDDNLEAEYIDTLSPRNIDLEEIDYKEMPIEEPSITINNPGSDYDEDKLFVLSLVPLLRRLSDYEKLDMKVNILNLFKSKYVGSSTSDFNGLSGHSSKRHLKKCHDESDEE